MSLRGLLSVPHGVGLTIRLHKCSHPPSCLAGPVLCFCFLLVLFFWLVLFEGLFVCLFGVLFLILWGDVLSACMSVFHLCAVPERARRGYQIPRNWSYGQL